MIRIDAERWRTSLPDANTLCRRAVQAGWTAGRTALAETHSLSGALSGPIEVSVMLSDDETVRDLNRDHRGKDTATNVLSFQGDTDTLHPGADILLGDVVLAWETIAREAGAAQKPIANHTTHLLIHGVLHLLGYDHESEDDATIMERIEVDSMTRLGLPNPYLDPPSKRSGNPRAALGSDLRSGDN